MFHFEIDKKTLYIVLGVLILFTILQYITNPSALFGLLISIPGVLIAITFHEFAHAFAADKLGDDTARREGRLSLNPLDHLDPIGSLMLLVAGFGWGKPVHVNPRNYTRKMSMEKGEAIVSIAGPVMNLLLALIGAIIYVGIYKLAGAAFVLSKAGEIILIILSSIITVNVGLGIFNLIPLPPLDGSKVIMPFLPIKAKIWFTNNERIFYIVFVILWITGLAGSIISPAISGVTNGILGIAKAIFSI